MSEANEEAEGPKISTYLRSGIVDGPPISPFITVAEDIEWFRDVWLTTELQPSELRRGSATLRRLLVDGLLHDAWKLHEMAAFPTVAGPDLLAIAALYGHEVRHGVSVIAGGAVRTGVVTCAFGAWKVRNATTGVGPDADGGFGVSVEQMARRAGIPTEKNELLAIAEKVQKIGKYLGNAGAIRRGHAISRRSIIQYFANYAGGVHLDKIKATNPNKHATFLLIEELEKSAQMSDLNGVFYELLSIGQAVGRSETLLELAAVIRSNSKGTPLHNGRT